MPRSLVSTWSSSRESRAAVADAWFESPLLRVLDARGRADLRAAATPRTLGRGGVAFVPGEPADTLWFVGSGVVTLTSVNSARSLGPRAHFGVEALVRGARRGSRAEAESESSLLEVPVAALRRVLARAGEQLTLAREEAAAHRQAFIALLGETPLGQGIDEAVLGGLVGELREERRERGEALFEANQPATAAFLVARGLLALGGDAGRVYAARGDWVALEQTLGGDCYGVSAQALGEVVALAVPAAALRTLERRDPAALARQRARDRARDTKQLRVEHLLHARATRHAFHELERLESAGSLLSIELDACVRCGHCTVACADAHGTPRLERRGEKVALVLADTSGSPRTSAFLFPQACQHCKDPVCLAECPTGAIGRDAAGAVHLREDLCTGCGACAKACPWDAIRMSERSEPHAPGASALVATKCDQCAGRDGPECVSACPTGALFRADPARDFVELRSALGAAGAGAQRRPARASFARWLMVGACMPPLVAIAGLHAAPERWPVASGVLAAAATLLLAAHAAVKRVTRVRAFVQKRLLPRLGGGLAPLVRAHSMLGVLAAALVLWHTGARLSAGVHGALALVFWLLAAAGGFGALVYRVLPARLTRLERRSSLPDDHPVELDALRQRLFSTLSDQNPAMKELARRVLVPYARAPWGPFALILSGRTLSEEEARVTALVERLLAGRKSERLSGARELVTTSVAWRALVARRLLETALGAWLPAHLVLALLFFVLLAVHVIGVSR
jgi:Fe-S-cluster-containing dehydrogenase component/CRP-like cAMP-binding protein